ncbi:5-hydroxytryptamine receptor 3A-like [Poeciliopsis prolifica]|uniref:5-hydroxytryptamine receptor 3A-like n=1 Tax=Poeciliopsis prolifica TaxID=188132 RepID=UPI00241324A5|nr:5-hydroxytryptamine receptor 3A-like [Poeciliopsis prolifica]
MAALRIFPFVIFAAGFCSSLSLDCTYYSLLDHLNLTASNTDLEMIRPVKNWTTATKVDLEMLLYGILGVDEKSQTVTSHIWVTKYWTNEFVRWNQSDFCGINEVSVPKAKLWIPEIVIQQDASDDGSIHETPWVIVRPDGSMFTFLRQRLTFTCRLNLYKFPFDLQRCNITFTSMDIDVNSLVLGSFTNDSVLTVTSTQFMITQGEWSLKDIELVSGNITNGWRYHSTISYIVTLERKPFLYVINFIIPLVYLLFLDLASFSIPVDSGEKFGFKVTVLLSISVLLLILKDILPSTEVDLPVIANLCVAVFTLVWLSVLESMLVSFLLNLDPCCDKESKNICMKRDIKVQKEAEEENGQVKAEQSFFPLEKLGDVALLKLILEEVKAARQEAGSQKKPRCYRRVATVIDNLFFVGYLLTFAAFVTYICVGWIDL